MYLYRAVDLKGKSHRFLSKECKKALQSFHHSELYVVIVDKNPTHPIAVEDLKKKMPIGTQIRQVKYLNNIVKQDHRLLKIEFIRCYDQNPFAQLYPFIFGIEAMPMVKKGQLILENKSV